MNKYALLIGAILTLLGSNAVAQQPISLARLVADGQAWTMTMLPEGRTGQIKLKPDGTGEMRVGPMNLGATWRETPNGLCISPSMVGERCAALTRDGGAIVGRNQGREIFRLSR